jgi:hypothetical protein
MADKIYITSLDGIEISFTENSLGHKAIKQLIAEGVQIEFLDSSLILQYIHNFINKYLCKTSISKKQKNVILKSSQLPPINNN